MQRLGIDIGGSGIKGALVDTTKGVLASERIRVATPQPATPAALAEAVGTLVRELGGDGRVGVAFPARVRRGVALTASNIDPSFIGTDIDALFTEAAGREVSVLNDADAAGLAEVRSGAARDVKGLVLMLTFGTGIGSALFNDGVLVPNTELGHIVIPGGRVAEPYAAERIRKAEDLSWAKWGKRVQEVLTYMEFLFAPDRIVVGGGVSKPERWAKFGPSLVTQAPICPAELGNEAGIVGAAAWAVTHDSI